MAIITIKVSDEKITVEHGKLPKARLAYTAAGLEVFKVGSSTYHHEDCIPNLVMNECLSRHIPLMSLRRVK